MSPRFGARDCQYFVAAYEIYSLIMIIFKFIYTIGGLQSIKYCIILFLKVRIILLNVIYILIND